MLDCPNHKFFVVIFAAFLGFSSVFAAQKSEIFIAIEVNGQLVGVEGTLKTPTYFFWPGNPFFPIIPTPRFPIPLPHPGDIIANNSYIYFLWDGRIQKIKLPKHLHRRVNEFHGAISLKDGENPIFRSPKLVLNDKVVGVLVDRDKVENAKVEKFGFILKKNGQIELWGRFSFEQNENLKQASEWHPIEEVGAKIEVATIRGKSYYVNRIFEPYMNPDNSLDSKVPLWKGLRKKKAAVVVPFQQFLDVVNGHSDKVDIHVLRERDMEPVAASKVAPVAIPPKLMAAHSVTDLPQKNLDQTISRIEKVSLGHCLKALELLATGSVQ